MESDRTASDTGAQCTSGGSEFFATYLPDTAVIAEARVAFSVWLAGAAPESSLEDEMLVVLSELLANAFAASVDGRNAVAVRASVDSDLTLEVTNPADAAFDTGSHWDYDDPLRPGGRGLMIVESLVDDLAITPPKGSQPLRVRCQRAL